MFSVDQARRAVGIVIEVLRLTEEFSGQTHTRGRRRERRRIRQPIIICPNFSGKWDQ